MSDLFDFKLLADAQEIDRAKRVCTEKAVGICKQLMPGTTVVIKRTVYGGKSVVSKVKMYGKNGSLVFVAPSGSKLLRYVAVQAAKWRDEKRFINSEIEGRILSGERLETLLGGDRV